MEHIKSKTSYISSASIPIVYHDIEDGLTKNAEFKIHVFEEERAVIKNEKIAYFAKIEHAVVVHGDVKEDMLVRIHSECLTGDIFNAVNCDCGEQLHFALAQIVKNKHGMVIYMRGHEGRGNGLGNKIRAVNYEKVYSCDTVTAHQKLNLPIENRVFDSAADILKDHFKLQSIRLITNNPLKANILEQYGVKTTFVPGWVPETAHNKDYLDAKVKKMGHLEVGRRGIRNSYFSSDSTPILFWFPEEPLANFYSKGFVLDGVTYKTAEHYYQSQKFLNFPFIKQQVIDAETSARAKEISRENKDFIANNWDLIKEDVMYKTVYEKFTQNEDLKLLLLNTGTRELIEDSPDDDYWGKTPSGGKNRMGVILMQLRENLKKT